MSAIWVFGFLSLPAQAGLVSTIGQQKNISPERLAAVLACLPKQLSQPNLDRAVEEMGNDFLERVFQLDADPEMTSAEAEFSECLNGKGYETRAQQFRKGN
ncbi:MAG: hypothetical protein HC835_11650 [Oscillatoriales cyanobacterium RM2_1_1]|nr:hypothetical protein [Oscillatoriales cyanobacterium RM2_1_1]